MVKVKMSASAFERRRQEEQKQKENRAVLLSSLQMILDSLTDEERHNLFTKYCSGCGSTDKGCQCWNDA